MSNSKSQDILSLKAQIHDLDTDYKKVKNSKRGISDKERLKRINDELSANRTKRKGLAQELKIIQRQR